MSFDPREKIWMDAMVEHNRTPDMSEAVRISFPE